MAAIAATVFLLGGALAPAHEAKPSPPASPADVLFPERMPVSLAGKDTPGQIAALQQALRRNDGNVRALESLGFAYQQRARETADPSYYPKSEGVLRRALALAPGDNLAVAGLGSLALSRHRFRDALVLGRRAVRDAPYSGRNWGVVGDALIELGRYPRAFKAFDTMVRVDPGLAAYARISYARELLGDQRVAAEMMRRAVVESNYQREPFAWTSVQLGKLFWSQGRIGAAAQQYRRALAIFPGYVYALDALAQVEGARGHLRRAIALERGVVDRTPLPQFVTTLGDLYAIAEQPVAARRQYALMDVIARLLRANGVKTDLELALFDVDHGIRTSGALRLARASYRDRPSIDGDDVLGWALARNGHCGEARHYSVRALRLGTRDALKYFHRGMIERCLGNRSAARVWLRRSLRQNAHFSVIWAPVARRYAR